MAILRNTRINSTEAVTLPAGTTSQRPTSALSGMMRFNTSTDSVEIFDGAEWINMGLIVNIGTESSPAPSGAVLKQARPTAPSGYYFIQSSSMPNPLEMYVDMETEGGGYDFYPIENGTSVSFYTDSHSGTPLGLDIVYPRSEQHWIAMSNFVGNVLGYSGSNYSRFFENPGKIYRTGGIGDYTGTIMRDPSFYGSGAPDWRVPDGGRWWLRDSTYNEPNGNYTNGSFLYFWNGDFRENYSGGDLLFDDGSTRSTGSFYLVSTNAKL